CPMRIDSMKRATRLLALVVLIGVIVAGGAWGQDRIYYIDPVTKKEATLNGPIESESPLGVKVKLTKESKLIKALGITRIDYKTRDFDLEFRAPLAKETRALLKETKPADRTMFLLEALRGFQDLVPKVRESPNQHRYILYKIAQTLAHLSKDDP